jgi:hypothetical protein
LSFFPVKNPLISVAVILLFAVASFASSATKSASKAKPSSSPVKSSKTGKAHTRSRKGKRFQKASWRRGQQKMDSDRARQVQAALIREHYLSGEPTGVWDQKSQKAMERFQADNGWQTKIIPDSRALIKLGLGPSNDHLLNPESAMTSPLQPTSTERIAPTSTPEHAAPTSIGITPNSAGAAEPVSNQQN